MSTRSILLTKGQFALVDADDYDLLMKVGRWCYSRSRYAVHYYTDELGRSKTLYMHRYLMERNIRGGISAGMQVDHRNNNRLDNRRSNLRLATRRENQAHKGQRKDSSSPFKGVTRNTGKWEARIKYGSQRINLGRFDKPEDAAWMYDAATRLLNKDFAGPNFSDHPRRAVFERVIAVLDKYGLETANLSRSEVFLRSR